MNKGRPQKIAREAEGGIFGYMYGIHVVAANGNDKTEFWAVAAATPTKALAEVLRLGLATSSCQFFSDPSPRGHEMRFTIEFFRIRKEDKAHATLARVTHIASDLESAKVKARSLFDVGTLNMPQNPDGLRILDQGENEVFFWTPEIDD
jgi:hypothetical protein